MTPQWSTPDAVQAFNLLAKLSQDSNTPVATISAQLVEQGSNATNRAVRNPAAD
jgi:hypothetical protein